MAIGNGAAPTMLYSNQSSSGNFRFGVTAIGDGALASLLYGKSSYLPTGWIPDDLERIHRVLFGHGEPWPYGVEPNRSTIEPFLMFCEEQGITQRLLSPAELFPKEVLFEVRI